MSASQDPKPTNPKAAPQESGSGLLDAARRISSAGAGEASRRLASAFGSAQALAGAASGKVAHSVSEAKAAVTQSLPDAKSVKVGVGRALLLSGQALIDPKAVVGNFAVELGQRLTASESGPAWLLLAATDDGFDLLARGNESEVRAAAASAAAQQRSVLVCKVMEAYGPAAGPSPPG